MAEKAQSESTKVISDVQEKLPAKKKSRIKNGKFDQIFKKSTEDDKIAIILQSTPDPDALGSALGLQWIFKTKYSLSSTIFYSGEVSHSENLTMTNVLGIASKKVDDYVHDEYIKTIVVDATAKNVDIDSKFIDIIFDHHRAEIKEENYDYVKIEQVGSCCSLICQLIQDLNLGFNDTDSDSIVATGLLLGIKTDTNSLLSENVTQLDLDSWSWLLPHIDKKKLSSILDYPLPLYIFDLKHKSYTEGNKKIINNTCLVSGVGCITPKQRDALPIISDEYIRISGITLSIVFAIINDNIEVSVRSSDPALEVNSFCQRIFGKEYAGGKLGSGGAKVPLGFLSIDEDSTEENKEHIWNGIKAKIFNKIENELVG